jgi:DNA-binding transcriptional LysR family regulator
MRRRLLPSLNALRSFEAVARHGSFTQAAAELNVTQSAASRLVRSLETYLEQDLFTRTGSRIELSEQGRVYAEVMKEALDKIEAATVEMIATRQGAGVLSVGMLPTFGTRWLIPRLSSFQAKHPEIALNIVSNDGPLDFAAQGLDVAVRFGSGHWPNATAAYLMSEDVVAVCSPALMRGPAPLVDYDALKRHRLIQHSTRPDAWRQWFAAAGLPLTDLQWGPSLEHFFMVIQAAIAALGVALLPEFLVEDEIRNGLLMVPFPLRVRATGGYYIITPAAKSEFARVKAFRSWILEESRAQGPQSFATA